jgi:hypothetical protein
MLGVTDFSVGINYFLPSLEKLLGELPELKDFPFDEWVP